MVKTIIGIMGPGSTASSKDLENAFKIGKFCASKKWITITGGRNEGVMNEALKGAKENGGLTLGILPSDDQSTFSEYLDIPICTNMRSGRNYLNALTSNIVVICGIDAGTSSEISLAIKSNKQVILVGLDSETNNFYKKLSNNKVLITKDFFEANEILKREI